jgi:hypothetical protein
VVLRRGAEGWSLDDKRQELLPTEKLGPIPAQALAAEEHAKNNLPDVLARWRQRVFFAAQRALIAAEIRLRAAALMRRRPLRAAVGVRLFAPTPSGARMALSNRSRSALGSARIRMMSNTFLRS